MSSFVFNKAKQGFTSGSISWPDSTMKIMLVHDCSLSCDTTDTSTTVTSAALFGPVSVGMSVTGTGIPANTTVTTVDSTSSITLSAEATADGSPTLSFILNRDQDFIASADGIELIATGYTGGFSGGGRKTLTSCAVVEDDVNDLAGLMADNVTWSAIDGDTATAAVIYKANTSGADSVMCFYIDSGFPIAVDGGDLTIVWSVDGIATLI